MLGDVVSRQVMPPFQSYPGATRAMRRDEQAQQGRLPHIQLISLWSKAIPEGSRGIAPRRRPHLVDPDQGVPVHDLHGFGQSFPEERRPQDVVPIHEGLQRFDVVGQRAPCLEAEHEGVLIRIGACAQHMVEQHAMLQWSEGIDVLDVASSSGNA